MMKWLLATLSIALLAANLSAGAQAQTATNPNINKPMAMRVRPR